MTNIYKRWQTKQILSALKTMRIVILSGARQCGKTTISNSLISKKITFRTLDDIILLQAAKNDPHEFVQHNTQTLIIDEVQRVPELILAAKKVVDQNNKPGQYLLTGSSNIHSLPGVIESLAGRARKIRLRTLTQGEMLGKNPNFLDNIFNHKFTKKLTSTNKFNIIDAALKGGFPGIINFDAQERKKQHKDYISSLIERDLQDVTHIKRKNSMAELINVLAAWSSKFMDTSSIGSSLSLQRPTLESYINALESLYIIERLYPWTKTDYERVSKQSKLFITDTGLMSSILNWKIDQVKFNPDHLGKLIETFVYNELASQVDYDDLTYQIYHYRDREKREIDFIIEREDGSLLGIEVKAGTSISSTQFKHLKWFEKNLAKQNDFIGIVLYTGEHFVSFGHNMWAIPINYLWST